LLAINDPERDGQVEATATMPRWLIAAFVIVGLSVVGSITYLRSQPADAPASKHSATTPTERHDPTPAPKPAPPAKPRPITTLIADFSDNRISELDADGKTILEQTAFGAWDVDLLPNGNLLVVEF